MALGGAERLAQLIATRGIGHDDTAEIATTCAVDHHTWENVLPAGTTVEDGVTVHRFPVGSRNVTRYADLHHRLLTSGSLTYAEELEYLANGVWSPELVDYLDRAGASYDLIVFIPYLFGTTFWGMQVHPDRSVLIPCLHDEPNAHMAATRQMIEASRACLFNTPAERRLAETLCNVPELSGIVGLGFDPPTSPPPPGFAAKHGLGRYVVYVGRLEDAKGVAIAAEHVARYARRHAPDLRLVLVGAGPFQPTEKTAPYIHFAGWLTEDEKRAAIAESIALVNPSQMESLSIVLLESWLEGIPALVSAGSDVMREHCENSGGGFAFRDYDQFAESLNRLASDEGLRREMGEAGRRYVHETASWDVVRQRFRDVTRPLAAVPR
jgi:glycosyltransferase involved in cell wall biosynthesis